VGISTSLALDSKGRPVVSYYESQQQDLKLLHCGTPDCNDGTPVRAATVTTSVHLPDHTPAPCIVSGCRAQGAPVGAVVHDQATVTSNDAAKTPTGSARFAYYAGNLGCSGAPASIEVVVLSGAGNVTTAESSSTAPLTAGDYSYRTQYLPDAAAKALGFVTTPGPCEGLKVQ